MKRVTQATQPQKQPKLIHLGTRIETVFGVQDADGNIVQSVPVRAEMGIFKPSSFTEAFSKIATEREKIVGQLKQQ